MNNKILPYKRLGKLNSLTTLIFLYGAGMSKEGMVPFVNCFESYNCIIFDLPNHGEADWNEKNSILSFSKEVQETILHLQDKNIISKKVILVGYSMGGAIAHQIALNRKIDLCAMVMISSGADIKNNSPVINYLKDASLEKFSAVDPMDCLFGEITSCERKNEIMDIFSRGVPEGKVIFDDLTICGEYNELKRCNEIHIPTFLVHGNDDAVVSLKSTIITSQNIKNSELMILPYGGHALIYEELDCVSKKVKFFIEKVLSKRN